MRHEAEAQLIKTLNGQLSSLPSVAKEMIRQYQMSAIALSIVCGLFILLTLVGTIYATKVAHEEMCDTDGMMLVSWLIWFTGGSVTIGFAIALC